MNDKTKAATSEGVLSRWSRLKREAQQTKVAKVEKTEPPAPVAKPAETQQQQQLTDADMPPLDTLTPDSDLAPFLSGGISDSLKRKAFRKIFLGQRFNIRDGLDDYDEDFTNFAALGDVVTAEYRRWQARYEEMQKERQNREAEETVGEETAAAADDTATPHPAASERKDENDDNEDNNGQ